MRLLKVLILTARSFQFIVQITFFQLSFDVENFNFIMQ